MKNLLTFMLLPLIFSAFVSTHKTVNRKEYRKSKELATYKGMENEFQDGYLILKENGYFVFYEKTWMVVSIKHGKTIGRYSMKSDTLHLNWLETNPQKIKQYISSKCIIDSTTKSLWFVDEIENKRLWKLIALNKQ